MTITLNGAGPGGARNLNLADNATLGDAIRAAGLDPAKYRAAIGAVPTSTLNTQLRPGDTVNVSPLKTEGAK